MTLSALDYYCFRLLFVKLTYEQPFHSFPPLKKLILPNINHKRIAFPFLHINYASPSLKLGKKMMTRVWTLDNMKAPRGKGKGEGKCMCEGKNIIACDH